MPNDCDCLTRAGLDLNIAVFLAEASQAAYGDPASVAAWGQSAGFTQVRFFERSNIQGFWCTVDDLALLVFRGTSNPGQWLRDVRFFPASHPWGRVHIGFRDGVAAVETHLLEFDAVAVDATHVWITGHSLGGALALVAAARSRSNGIVPSLYTFGQPRVGLGDFADRFGVELPGRLHRFVNQSDIVTRVPPGLFYRHTGILKRIVRPGVLESIAVLEMPPPADPRLRAQTEVLRRLAGSPALESAAVLEAAGVIQPLLIDADISPLSEAEFAELQMSLGAGAATPGLESAALEGAIPWFGDHAISEYIRLLDEIRG